MPLKSRIPQAKAAIDRAADRLVFRLAHRIRNHAVESILKGPKTGRVYKRKGVTHRASAPGQPPAADLGRLAQSITVKHTPGSKVATVIAGTKYARLLEMGTRRVAPRPFMRPAIGKVQQEGVGTTDIVFEMK
jgi:HK97 gp10 family phage protein